MGKRIFVTEGMEVEPATDGWHHAVVAEVVDLGEDTHPQYGKRHQGVLMIELDEPLGGDGELADKRKECRVYFDFRRGLGSSKKGTVLRARLEEWRGTWKRAGGVEPRPFTEADLSKYTTEGMDLDTLVGRPLRVLVTAEKAKTSDAQFNKVLKFAPPDKDYRLQVSEDYVPYHKRSRDEQGTQAQDPPPKRSSAPAADAGDDVDDDDLPF